MSEVDRENVLAERLEQMQKIQDRRKLQEMIKQQKNGSGDADAVAKAAKRTDNTLIITRHHLMINSQANMLSEGLLRRSRRNLTNLKPDAKQRMRRSA